MPQSAAVLCHDSRSLRTLAKTLAQLGVDLTNCRSERQALESVMAGSCSTLIVDFDLEGAEEVIRMAKLLPERQKPALVALSTRVWPGSGQAFQSGAERILYKPLEPEVIRESMKSARRAARANRRRFDRHELKTLVYLELESGTIPALSIDIGEQGLALQTIGPVPIRTQVSFHCALPGTQVTIQGHADVVWASDQGRAGLLFSKLGPTARRHLKNWLAKRGHTKHPLRDLLPPANDHVWFAATREESELASAH